MSGRLFVGFERKARLSNMFLLTLSLVSFAKSSSSHAIGDYLIAFAYITSTVSVVWMISQEFWSFDTIDSFENGNQILRGKRENMAESL
jgi:hypothetical protein